MFEGIYGHFAGAPSARHWQKIGLRKRSGVAVPLFSIYSEQSAGIGEIPDLKLLIDWCVRTGITIVQLLPLNDVGFKFYPYDAESMFALDPMYLALHEIPGGGKYSQAISRLRKEFPAGKARVDYGIKGAKLAVLWKMFSEARTKPDKEFARYLDANHFWLDDFALFKVLKEAHHERSWWEWAPGLSRRSETVLAEIRETRVEQILFQKWLQGQLFLQLSDVKRYAEQAGVFLMGDLPFLVSRDSADVWARQNYFKLDLAAGAPPDSFFAMGQRWGMPPYHWEMIRKQGYDYLAEKLRYSENFYHMFRIDHTVGLFRVWTIPISEPLETGGLKGRFDPEDKTQWYDHGKNLILTMLEKTTMLPCAEDLGVVPDCSYQVLEELCIPGMDVQRWKRDWEGSLEFLDPEKYRKNGMAVISTHDMAPFRGWWDYELGTVDEILFRRSCDEQGISFEVLAGRLFDLSRSEYGRLHWRSEILSDQVFLACLGIGKDRAYALLKMYRETFDEKSRFLKFLFGEKIPARILSGTLSDEDYALLMRTAIHKAHEASTVFSIHLLQDYLSSDPKHKLNAWEHRINMPGTLGTHNWSLTLPWSLEQMLKLKINSILLDLNRSTGRI
ncbi:MAG: 4-alpha-glucanotransferase [Candidatus Omnitrophota bacterium]